MTKFTSRAMLLAAAMSVAPGVFAQKGVTEGPFTKTFTIGGRASYLPLGSMLMKPSSAPISNAGLHGTKKFGGGAALELSFKRKFGLDLDAIYRAVGFWTVTDTDIATTVLQTKARYYDFPLTFRYNYFGRTGFASHLFVRGGVALRKVSNLKTTRDVTDNEGNTASGPTGSPLNHGTVRGLVAGGGMRFRDDFGIKVTPEVRYTRWMAQTFSTAPFMAKRDQLEVVVGITF
ncbi:MAG: hypothetical protein HZB13_14330 [Acidobacteria bacterium]|nr:hypothetical protein [Acidobacteriota bacterium]